jgi:hypothetical protein
MSTRTQLYRRLDQEAVQRAERVAPRRYAEVLRGRDRRNIRRSLRRLGYHEGYVTTETERLSAMQPHYRRAALHRLRKRLGVH